MGYAHTVKQYLTALQKEYQSALSDGQHTAELSYRPILDTFFRNLAKDLTDKGSIDVVLEPRSQGKIGRPDWRIHDSASLGVYGYVEAKGFSDQPFDIIPYQTQIKRYLSLQHKLILTDGIEFIFCMNEHTKPIYISLIDKTKLTAKDWSRLIVSEQFELLMRQFFGNPSAWQCEEEKLAELTALRARRLADKLVYYAGLSYEEAMNEEERQAIHTVIQMKDIVRQQNVTYLKTEREFANFTAQAMLFELFYAHRILCDSTDLPKEREAKIRQYLLEISLTENVFFIGRFFEIAQKMDSETRTNVLTKRDSFLQFEDEMYEFTLQKEKKKVNFILEWIEECICFFAYVQLTEKQRLHPDYHRLFELFLKKYDEQVRFDYGAYYTPDILAGFVVALTEQVIQQELKEHSLFDDENFILDPCCGTGSFLEQIVLQDKQDGAYTLCGLEMMPVPYMLARCRMAVLQKKYRFRNYESKLFLKNTLHNQMFTDGEVVSYFKQDKVTCLEQQNKLIVLIGNPPCSDSVRKNVSEEFSEINELLEDFRPPVALRKARQNIQKQISNPYIQFLRWGCEYMMQNAETSVLAFVVPLSFLEAESYRYARKYMIEHFSGIWVVAIDADARTGVRSDSMFKTLQGRAVIVLTRKKEQSTAAEYHFLDISHCDRQTKEMYLTEQREQIVEKFCLHSIQEGNYSFAPVKPFPKDLYEKFWAVSGEDGQQAIFLQHCSGIKLAPTALFTHTKLPMLKRRSKEIAAEGNRAAKEWLAKQDRPPKEDKVNAFQTALCSLGTIPMMDKLLSDYIKPYSFRPFLTSYVLMWKELLATYAKIGGGGTRLRPELLAAYEKEETFGFAMAHAPKDLNPTLTQFVSFCWYYPDNDMCTRGNSHIYMNRFLDKQTGTLQTNVNKVLLDKLEAEYGMKAESIVNEVIFYTFAVLCSQVYLDTFEGALFTMNQSDNRARVPFVKDKAVFLQLATLGKQLARLECVDYVPDNVLGLDYESLLGQLPDNFQLQNLLQPFDEERELLLLSDGVVQIEVPCPLSLQKKNISGYDVIKNAWIKFHSYAFTHCAFTKEDFRALLHVLNTLAIHEQLIVQADQIVYDIMQEKYEFI